MIIKSPGWVAQAVRVLSQICQCGRFLPHSGYIKEATNERVHTTNQSTKNCNKKLLVKL